jgi:hypothetical protein
MKPRERYVTALNCRTPDRVPVVEYLFNQKLQPALLGCATPLSDSPSQLAIARTLGRDGMWIPINGFCGVEEVVHAMSASYQDEWGVPYLKHGCPIMVQTDTPIESRADWTRYTMPKARAARGSGMSPHCRTRWWLHSGYRPQPAQRQPVGEPPGRRPCREGAGSRETIPCVFRRRGRNLRAVTSEL